MQRFLGNISSYSFANLTRVFSILFSSESMVHLRHDDKYLLAAHRVSFTWEKERDLIHGSCLLQRLMYRVGTTAPVPRLSTHL